MKKYGGRCRKVCGHPTLFYVSPTLFHSFSHLNIFPYTLHTNPIHSSTPLRTTPLLPYSPYLTPLSKLPKISQFFYHPYSPKFSTLPLFFPILPHTYFIIYPTLKFLTFLIYCLISLAIKYKRPIKILKTNIKNGNTTSKLFKKFCVIVDIPVRNNAFLLSGSTLRIIHRHAL